VMRGLPAPLISMPPYRANRMPPHSVMQGYSAVAVPPDPCPYSLFPRCSSVYHDRASDHGRATATSRSMAPSRSSPRPSPFRRLPYPPLWAQRAYGSCVALEHTDRSVPKRTLAPLTHHATPRTLTATWQGPQGTLSSQRHPSFLALTLGKHRGVAQSGSALGWGPSGRRFKSSRPDHAGNRSS
jgi:hypothetical protein